MPRPTVIRPSVDEPRGEEQEEEKEGKVYMLAK